MRGGMGGSYGNKLADISHSWKCDIRKSSPWLRGHWELFCSIYMCGGMGGRYSNKLADVSHSWKCYIWWLQCNTGMFNNWDDHVVQPEWDHLFPIKRDCTCCRTCCCTLVSVIKTQKVSWFYPNIPKQIYTYNIWFRSEPQGQYSLKDFTQK